MIDFRILWVTLALAGAGCSSNNPAQTKNQKPQAAANEETSWYCEQGPQTWSCQRRTIADIQARQQERKNKRFDWSSPTESGQTDSALAAVTDSLAETNKEKAAPGQSNQITPTQPAPAGTSVGVQQSLDAIPSLRDLPADHWAVQLIALGSKAELQAFIDAQELDVLSGATIRVKGRIYYVALLGVYPSRLAAEQAAAARPASLQRYEPYIRSMASLQAAMAAVTDA